MAIEVTPSGATLGATVTGVALARLTDDEWAVIEAAFHEHAVLVLPGQFPDDDTQTRFARRFGRLERGMGELGSRRATVWPIANVLADGRLAEPDSALAHVLAGNQEWHSDSSYHDIPSKASMLSARVVPAEGGETEWADMRAAYDALDDDDRRLVEGRTAAHSYLYSQRKVGKGDELWTDADKASMAGVRHPLVSVHPVTGRRSLFVGRHAHAVSGLDEPASEALVARLVAEACRPPRVLTHRWQPGDLVVWDNRCVLHRGRPWDSGAPRVMAHTRVAGDGDHEWALDDTGAPWAAQRGAT